MLFGSFFICKLFKKTSILLIKKKKIAAALVNVFLVTCISGSKSIFLFGHILLLEFVIFSRRTGRLNSNYYPEPFRKKVVLMKNTHVEEATAFWYCQQPG